MNTLVYEKNMDALRKKYPAWAEILEDKKRKKRNFDVIAEQSMMGDTILKVRANGKQLYLNGKYAPSMVVERWIEQQGKIEAYTPVVIVGISNGIHIKRIMETVPKTSNILIYEPSFELFRRAMEEVDLSFLFELDKPVGVIVKGLNESEIAGYFHYMISFDNMTSLKYYISGNYKVLFREEVEDFVKKLKKYVEDQEIQWNTYVRYTNVKAKNTFHNICYLSEGYSVEALKGILPADVPAIVVSAGPSLNKNLMDLKKAVGKACIIATDTAMKGKKFFYYSDSQYEEQMLNLLSNEEGRDMTLPNIPTGGSVANNAYSMGVYMGARTIILIGQDLAMTGNRTHADGTFKDKMDEIDAQSGEYFEVEAIDGGKVLTREDFNRYRIWFEDRAKEWKHITMVDATEGGALIHGSKIMTLKHAIRKYCKRDYNVKWHIDHSKKLFSEENRHIALDHFLNSEKKLQEVKKKAKEGIRYYERLEKLMHKSTVTDNELKKVLKRIKKINNYIEQDYMAETVRDSLQGIEYILRAGIYQIQEERKDELIEVAQQGELMLTAVCAGVDEIVSIAKETVIPYAKEQIAMSEKNSGKSSGSKKTTK